MAKKKESKAKQHTRDLVAGMRSSNSQSRTPISSLYPKKVNVGSSSTSQASRSKGTHSSSPKSRSPQKFLLSVTNPGNRPAAPLEPKAPAKVDRPTPLDNIETYRGYDRETRDWMRNPEGERGAQLRAQHEEANAVQTKAFRNYDIASADYNRALTGWNASMATYRNTTLPNWNTADSQYRSRTKINTSTTSSYNKDATKFLNSLRSKSNKVTPKIAAKMRGARNTNTRLGGARS